MTTYICTLYYSPQLFSHCCLRSQNPDYHSGGHPRSSHSVLLPSEPIKRPSQHSVAIQATPTLFALEEERGLREGKGGGRHELPRNTYICTHILHLYTPPPPPAPPPFHALSLCGVQVPRSGVRSRERRGGEEKGEIGRASCRERV